MKRTLTTVLGLLVVALLLGPIQQANAQTLRIGYTEAEGFIQYLPETQQVQQTLQREAQQTQAQLEAQLATLQEKFDRYQQQQALLSEETRLQREAEITQLQQELQQADARSQQQLAAREAELLEPILNRVQQAIDDVAREKGLDIVLRAPMLLYVDESKIVNISLDVARKLGIEVPEELE